MAHSLEARVPLLDHPLVEFALSLPQALKAGQGAGKRVFREAVAGLVPDSVLRKRKQGFGVPLGHWFRGPLRYRIDRLLEGRSRIFDYVDPVAVRRMADEHRRNRRDHSDVLWRLLALDLWFANLESGELSRPWSSVSPALSFRPASARKLS